MSTAGIMDPAFFVGKRILLDWLNDFFEVNYTKVEQAASGAIHCQILDAIFPGKVPLHKVNFDAKFDYEFVKNYKVLQSVFNKEQIERHIPVDRLIKAKYQDNLEMLQWMKHFFDSRYAGQEYHARERRERGRGRKVGKRPVGGSAHSRAPRSAASKENTAPRGGTRKPAAKKSARAAGAGAGRVARQRPATSKPPRRTATSSAVVTKLKEAEAEVEEMRLTVEGLEKERNFYFGKLREIEVKCQEDDSMDQSAKDMILAILYKTDEAEGFEAPEDDEEDQAGEGHEALEAEQQQQQEEELDTRLAE